MTLLRLGLVCIAALMTGQAAESRPRASTPEVKKEVVATIEAQLAAFRCNSIRDIVRGRYKS